MNELPKELIEKALALCDKKEDYIELWCYDECIWYDYHKFFYYLLSSEFIEKYTSISINFDRRQIADKNDKNYKNSVASDIWYAIYEYQSWNSEPIISLLTKIWTTKK